MRCISSCTITSSRFSCFGFPVFSRSIAFLSSQSILKSPVFLHLGSSTNSSFTSHAGTILSFLHYFSKSSFNFSVSISHSFLQFSTSNQHFLPPERKSIMPDPFLCDSSGKQFCVILLFLNLMKCMFHCLFQ